VSTLNLGILAHVDAGKTSLTERLLYAAGVIDTIGSVDAGSTQTDSMALERQRGITIKSAVVSFEVDGVTINLIDTPGHPDFIAEVERVLSVLDGAVLVISAVEGVQAQTRVLMRTLRRLRIPTLIFVNKIDRGGAQYDALLGSIAKKLSPAIVPMGSVRGLGTRDADTVEAGLPNVEVLAEHDDALLAAYVEGGQGLSHGRLRNALAAQTKQSLTHPVFFGSAITGAGVAELISGITGLLPASDGDPSGPLSGTVFKVERGAAGEKIAYARLFSGTLAVRDRVRFGDDKAAKVTAISVFDNGTARPRQIVRAGEIGKLLGLTEIQIGDPTGKPQPVAGDRFFAPPTLETVVVPEQRSNRGALHAALTQLAEQDPLIDLRHDELRQETSVSLYGEVQKEIIQATLASDFGVDVTFRETTMICIERPVGTGAAFELIGHNPFLATVGLRVEPAAPNSGVAYRLEVEYGSMPHAFFTAVEETVRETLQQGLNGWQVTDCVVIMTHSGYYARQSHAHGTFDKSMSSTAGDFRYLTPLVLMDALRQAETEVLEPMHRFRLDIPDDTFRNVLPALVRLGALVTNSELRGTQYQVDGDVPAARVHDLQRQLPSLSRGEAMLETEFSHYQPVRGARPSRSRTDHNPFNRKEYLLHVVRRV
jgi:ribosomal protection tetracycline resistance protein